VTAPATTSSAFEVVDLAAVCGNDGCDGCELTVAAETPGLDVCQAGEAKASAMLGKKALA